jgi:hypothetical protein
MPKGPKPERPNNKGGYRISASPFVLKFNQTLSTELIATAVLKVSGHKQASQGHRDQPEHYSTQKRFNHGVLRSKAY